MNDSHISYKEEKESSVIELSCASNGFTQKSSSILEDCSNFNMASIDLSNSFADDTNIKICLIGSEVTNNSLLVRMLKSLNYENSKLEVIGISDEEADRLEFPAISWSRGDPDNKCIYIISNFENHIYEHLKRDGCRIFGPTCIIDLISRSLSLTSFPFNSVYTLTLTKAIIVFSGFEKERKAELSKLTKISHFMGARVKVEINKSVTHLVACDVRSSLYEDAIAMGIDVVSVDWISYCWEKRNDVSFCGTNSDVTINFHIKPFTGLCIAFYGFAPQEHRHMEEVALANGAVTTDCSTNNLTHIVVDEAATFDMSFVSREKVWAVTSQWFWKSVQYQVNVAERFYVIPQIELKKKKIVKEDDDKGVFKSPTHSVKRSPLSGLFNLRRKSYEKSPVSTQNISTTKRTHNFMELLNTERNYVEVLRTLVEVFKIPLESGLNDKYGPIISSEDIKIIFGAIPDILKLHSYLLSELEEIERGWSDTPNIGSIFDKHIEGFLKSYPIFINYFEIIKETVFRIDSENQRFHAFLKVCLVNPRCSRQSLCEILIRPVQRLPSIILVLKELLKHTSPSSSDYPCIQRAIDSLTYVLNQINEDKRKTEEQLQMVEVYNNIEGCPPYVLSAQRHFVLKIDAVEIFENGKCKGQNAILFLFSDSLEIAKKRQTRLFSNVSSNNNLKASSSISSLGRCRSYKHCYFIFFKNIINIIDMTETDYGVLKNSFGIIFRKTENDSNVSAYYRIIGEKASFHKQELLSILVKAVSCARSMQESEFLSKSDQANHLKRTESPLASLGRALENLALKTSRRMSRAFSIKSKSDSLPRSISVTSQVAHDNISISSIPEISKGRKSIQTNVNTTSITMENSQLMPNSPFGSIKKKDLNDEKKPTRKKISLWRRSIQTDEF